MRGLRSVCLAGLLVWAAALVGVGRTLFLGMDCNGRLGPTSVKLGRCRRWSRAELARADEEMRRPAKWAALLASVLLRGVEHG